jgi:hypothetical protein
MEHLTTRQGDLKACKTCPDEISGECTVSPCIALNRAVARLSCYEDSGIDPYGKKLTLTMGGKGM